VCRFYDTERREEKESIIYRESLEKTLTLRHRCHSESLATGYVTGSVEIPIARSLYILNYRSNRVILYTAFRVCLVRMHAHSVGISS
jgi:hypothetical protein